jgi:hypothetical protein
MREMIRLMRDEEERPPVLAGDFYVVVSQYSTFYVSPETAARIGRVLDRRWLAPRWVKFTDLSGARIWLLRRNVEAVYESTETQRSTDRQFHRARRLEERADRTWDEEYE